MLQCPLPLLCHDQQVSRALRLHHHQMLCRKHPIPRCWNVVFSGLRAEGCACSLDGGYSTKWIAYGSFRPLGSGRIVHGKGTPTCNPCNRCRLEGAFGHRTVCCSPDARNMVFGILESGLSVAGSLVGIFVCIAGVAEYLRKKSLYIAPWCLRKRSRRSYL